MVESLTVTVGWLAVGCFLFATTDGRSLALIAVLAIVFEHFPEGRIDGVDVVDVADVAASAVEKVSDRGPNDTAAAESACTAVVCCAAVVVSGAVAMIGEGKLMRGNSSSLARFLSSSCPSHTFWNWQGASCCPALLLLLRNSTLCR
jgi:hypothetical protein